MHGILIAIEPNLRYAFREGHRPITVRLRVVVVGEGLTLLHPFPLSPSDILYFPSPTDERIVAIQQSRAS